MCHDSVCICIRVLIVCMCICWYVCVSPPVSFISLALSLLTISSPWVPFSSDSSTIKPAMVCKGSE